MLGFMTIAVVEVLISAFLAWASGSMMVPVLTFAAFWLFMVSSDIMHISVSGNLPGRALFGVASTLVLLGPAMLGSYLVTII